MAPTPPHASVQNKSVAIIGGGVSGLMCALKLRQLGISNVTVYDTGKNAVGGRMSSRDVKVAAPGGAQHVLRLDHSAQMLSATTPRFQRVLDHWHELKLIAPYASGAVGTVQASDGAFISRREGLPQVYYPTRGMRAVSTHLAEGLEVRRPMWVGRVTRRDPSPGAPVLWDVIGERSKHLGSYDYLVIAHNGKCADRLMSTADAPDIHALLRTKFTPVASPQQVMQMCSLWVGLMVFPSSLKLPYDAAFIEGDPDLSFISNNTTRVVSNRDAAPLEAWTVISTRKFGSDNKVPQEAIPPAKDKEVKSALLDALARVTRVPRETLTPVYERLQLWGAAVPLNVTNTPCVFDAGTQCGIAGDWLVAPSIEGAALSGLAMAEQIAKHASGASTDSVGLHCAFQPVQGPPLGAVPTGRTHAPEAASAPRGGGGGRGARTGGGRGERAPAGAGRQGGRGNGAYGSGRGAGQGQNGASGRDQSKRPGSGMAAGRGGWAQRPDAVPVAQTRAMPQ